MNRQRSIRTLLAGACLALAACTPAAAPEASAPAAESADTVAGDAVTAPSAPAADAPEPAAGPASPHATFIGRVSYPSEELPAMRVCALATEDLGWAYCTDTAVNAPHYELRVPPGTWIVMAWPQDTGASGEPGLISQASECLTTGGLDCDDHGWAEFTVAAGERREGLDINDWYYPPEATPLPMQPRGEVLE